jgi:hypothetical protein
MNLSNVVKRCAVSGVSAVKNLAREAGEVMARPLVVGSAGLVMASGANAAGAFTLDTTDIVAVITSGVTAVSAIGVAVISLVVVIKLFKWVQRVL